MLQLPELYSKHLTNNLSTFIGENIKSKGIAKYIFCPTEPHRTYSRHSSFTIGLSGQNWLDIMAFFQDVVLELLHFSTHMRSGYPKVS